MKQGYNQNQSIIEYIQDFSQDQNTEDVLNKHHDRKLTEEETSIGLLIFEDIHQTCKEDTTTIEEKIENLRQKSVRYLSEEYDPEQLYFILSPNLYDFLITLWEL